MTEQNSGQQYGGGLNPGQQAAQTSMILGIISIFVLGIILGPMAIVKAKKAERDFQTDATVGKVTGWIGTIFGALSVVGLIIYVAFVASLVGTTYSAVSPLSKTEVSNGVGPSNEIYIEPSEAQQSEPAAPAQNQPIRIGVPYDKIGFGFKEDGSEGDPVGFDVDVARYIASDMGFSDENIQFISAPSANRETLLTTGQVDFLVSTYGQNPAREELVSFAGSYISAATAVAVPQDSSIQSVDDLNGKALCGPIGSSATAKVQEELAPGVELVDRNALGDCFDEAGLGVDAIANTDMFLAGIMAQPEFDGKFRLLDEAIDPEVISVGVPQGSSYCSDIGNALENMFSDGSWATALTDHFTDEVFIERNLDSPPNTNPSC